MSFRGRGGGGGRGRGHFRGGHAPQRTWEHFPEINELGTAAGIAEKLSLAKSYSKLHSYWKSSPYFLDGDDAKSKGAKRDEIERFSDMNVAEKRQKTPLSDVIRMKPEYVPSELARAAKTTPPAKRRWIADSNLDSDYGWNLLEKREQASQGHVRTEKKEVEEDEDENEEGSDKEEEEEDEGDYEQNEDFDDDEDDFNPPDDDDEPDYE